MNRRSRTTLITALTLTAFTLTGCSGLDQMSEKLKTASEEYGSEGGGTSKGDWTVTAKQAQDAKAKLEKLRVKGRESKTGYDRAKFMSSSDWTKARQEIYHRDFVNIETNSKGNVKQGVLKVDPYTGKEITYVLGGKSEVDIEHVVALGDVWVSDGFDNGKVNPKVRAISTDPENLIAVDASANRQKGDADAATWLPSNKAYRCTYVVTQVKMKDKYGLSVKPAEKAALNRELNKCGT